MKTKIFTKVSAIVIVSILMMTFAVTAYAKSSCSGPHNFSTSTNNYSSSKSLLPLMQCGYSNCHDCDFKEASILVSRLLNWFISMAGVVATITFSIAGFKILTHPDNPSEITAGWDMFKKTVWGLLIVIGAWVIVNTVVSALVKSNSALFFLRN